LPPSHVIRRGQDAAGLPPGAGSFGSSSGDFFPEGILNGGRTATGIALWEAPAACVEKRACAGNDHNETAPSSMDQKSYAMLDFCRADLRENWRQGRALETPGQASSRARADDGQDAHGPTRCLLLATGELIRLCCVRGYQRCGQRDGCWHCEMQETKNAWNRRIGKSERSGLAAGGWAGWLGRRSGPGFLIRLLFIGLGNCIQAARSAGYKKTRNKKVGGVVRVGSVW